MKTLSISKIRITLFFLALVGPILACQSPAIGSECEEVNRSLYEQEARVLGEVPETPEFPEGAVYKVCYTDGELTSVQMKDGKKPDEEDLTLPDTDSGEEKQDVEDDLIATYRGTSEIPSFQQEVLSYTIDENQTTLYVYESGKVTGEQVVIISYTHSGVKNALVYATTSWKIALVGTLEGGQGDLSATQDYHFVSKGPGASSPQDQSVTTQFVYKISLSGDTITNGTKSEVYFPFEVTKQ